MFMVAGKVRATYVRCKLLQQEIINPEDHRKKTVSFTVELRVILKNIRLSFNTMSYLERLSM
jgi:hypothetical protein